MTMSVEGKRKIYTSTDKIFELSEKDPIGLMVYNNLEFMGAPLDVVIKQFRASQHCCSFEHLADAAEAFFSYLTSEWMASEALQKRHARDLLTQVYSQAFDAAWKQKDGVFKPKAQTALEALLDYVSEQVESFENIPIADCFSDVSEDYLRGYYQETLDDVISRVLRSPPLDEEGTFLCHRLGVLALHRDVPSDMMSGFVFAGFGKSEIFPSLIHFETDGIIAGRLKTKVADSVETTREHISAAVVPFAQRDVVDRFLAGVDPQLQEGVSEYVSSMMEKTSGALFKDVKGVPTKAKDAIRANLADSLGGLAKEFAPWLERVKKSYTKETEDMLLFMPKSEAAHLAESLVNITSLKRKYSAGEESVAGPIDVAVISRSDGFVWVKRKHYFPAELNHRFFVRKFGANDSRSGGEYAQTT